MTEPLRARDREMLILAARLPATSKAGRASVEDRCFEKWGIRPVVFYQELTRIIKLEAAAAYDPITVKRLQDQIDRRRGWINDPQVSADFQW